MSVELRAVAWMVVDERGYESLHRERARATNYLSHVRGGVLYPLVKLSAATAALEEARLRAKGEGEA